VGGLTKIEIMGGVSVSKPDNEGKSCHTGQLCGGFSGEIWERK